MPADGEADIKRLCGLSGDSKVPLKTGVPGLQALDIRDAAILKLNRREFSIGRVAVQDPASAQVDLLLREEPADEAAAFGFGPEVNRDAADIKLGTGETGYRQIGAFDREIDEDWCKPGMEDQSRSPSASGTRRARGEASELISTFFSVSFGQ